MARAALPRPAARVNTSTCHDALDALHHQAERDAQPLLGARDGYAAASTYYLALGGETAPAAIRGQAGHLEELAEQLPTEHVQRATLLAEAKAMRTAADVIQDDHDRWTKRRRKEA